LDLSRLGLDIWENLLLKSAIIAVKIKKGDLPRFLECNQKHYSKKKTQSR